MPSTIVSAEVHYGAWQTQHGKPSRGNISKRLTRISDRSNKWQLVAMATAQKPWNDARRHASHRIIAPWWDASTSGGLSMKERDEAGQAEHLPMYFGWPTAGPSDDKLLLKMRTTRYNGHVDWACWTREMKKETRKVISRTSFTKVPASEWCKNYGYIGTDGQIHWPTAQPSHARVVGMAWNEVSAKPAQVSHIASSEPQKPGIQPEMLASARSPEDRFVSPSNPRSLTKSLTEKLKEGEDLWAMLRCAYLAGADNGEPAAKVAEGAELDEAEPATFDDLDVAAQTVQDRLQRLLRKTAEASKALSRNSFCATEGRTGEASELS